jgi:DNA (cytosine-5)-methyltransferase 1
MGYIGSKAGAGVFHAIIAEMPPHSVYVEPFFGSGAIFHKKRPAASSIVIDRDPDCVAKVSALAGVRAVCGNALEILPTLTLPADALVYCDPPYLLETRKNRRYYKFEMEREDHARLLDILKALKCRVLLSGYFSPIYVAALRDWRVCRFQAATRGGPRTEWLWCNFPESAELHDWRFAGRGNKRGNRERLNFGRLAARWLARIEAMPARKRGFLLNAITQIFPCDLPRLGTSSSVTVTDQAATAIDLSQSGASCRRNALELPLPDPRAENDADRSTRAVSGARIPNGAVFSLFPGADLLGRGFEQAGYLVFRGPDKLWGQRIEDFRGRAGLVEGVIGGPPCPDFSSAQRGAPTGEGVRMLAEFARVVTEMAPEWFLLENVPAVPDVQIAGYTIQRFHLAANECGLAQRRLRAFQFGSRDGSKLMIPRVTGRHSDLPVSSLARAVTAHEGQQTNRRSWPDVCELMGLPRDFELPGWSVKAKNRAVGNGVPVPMARVIAEAIKQRHETKFLRLCICGCAREVPEGRTLATAACRKRMQRRRERMAMSVESDTAGRSTPG